MRGCKAPRRKDAEEHEGGTEEEQVTELRGRSVLSWRDSTDGGGGELDSLLTGGCLELLSWYRVDSGRETTYGGTDS